MAVASFDQDTLEEVIGAAVEAGLADEACRAQLLAHLPPRFVEKIELRDDPVEQLRADVSHLNANPRLPDHHQPPLASWLQNAYLITTPSPEARRFRELRTRLVGAGRQQEILRSLTRIKKITAPEAERIVGERPSEPRAGLLLGGRFALEKRLGRGAVAEVWRARDLAAGTPVAVKLLHRRWAENPERRTRFFAGARQMASFAHPHIVPVIIPEGQDAGHCYCVLDYLDAGDLEAALREGRIRRSAALRALLRVASGVAAMHSAGVVHLDIKPHNILLGTDGRVMLGDFDRVRHAASEGGPTTDTVESIFYLAPETFDDSRRPGPTADVFSLGMTALFVLHGDKLPAWIVRRPAALLRRIDCAEAVRAVIGRAIELEPAARFADVESMALALQEALGRSSTGSMPRVAPIISSPPPAAPGERAGRAGRSTGGLPPVSTLTDEGAGVRGSGAFRSLSRSGAFPVPTAAEAFDEAQAPPRVTAPPGRSTGSMRAVGRSTGELPPPSIPPPSLPPAPVDLPPAGTGELELEDSVDSALEMLDRAAAEALAEEFARKPPRTPTGSALLPPAGEPRAWSDAISGSIDLDGPVEPISGSGPHASIPGDENRSPWQWVARSGGFLLADDASLSEAERAASERPAPHPASAPPARAPWNWAGTRAGEPPVITDPAPPPTTESDAPDEPAPLDPPVVPAPTSLPVPDPPRAPAPVAVADEQPEGALPADLSPEALLAAPAPDAEPEDDDAHDELAGRTAEDVFLPPPPDLADLEGLAAFAARPAPERRRAVVDEASTAPVAGRAPVDGPTEPDHAPPAPEEPAFAPEVVAPPDRRRFLMFGALGALGATAAWLVFGRREPPLVVTPVGGAARPPTPAAAPAARPVVEIDPIPLDAGAPDAAQPDAAPPDAAPPDAAPDAAQPDAAAPDAATIELRIPEAPPPPRRRRKPRRARKPRRPREPARTPAAQKPAPEPLIEIPDEIRNMLDE